MPLINSIKNKKDLYYIVERLFSKFDGLMLINHENMICI